MNEELRSRHAIQSWHRNPVPRVNYLFEKTVFSSPTTGRFTALLRTLLLPLLGRETCHADGSLQSQWGRVCNDLLNFFERLSQRYVHRCLVLLIFEGGITSSLKQDLRQLPPTHRYVVLQLLQRVIVMKKNVLNEREREDREWGQESLRNLACRRKH